MQHTAGPWIVTVEDTINGKPAYWFVRDAHGIIGDIQSANPADAALIAAAPTMLEALRHMASFTDHECADNCMAAYLRDCARDAIAAATGDAA